MILQFESFTLSGLVGVALLWARSLCVRVSAFLHISEMSDIDVRSRQERESGGFFRGVRARVRSAFGDG